MAYIICAKSFPLWLNTEPQYIRDRPQMDRRQPCHKLDHYLSTITVDQLKMQKNSKW